MHVSCSPGHPKQLTLLCCFVFAGRAQEQLCLPAALGGVQQHADHGLKVGGRSNAGAWLKAQRWKCALCCALLCCCILLVQRKLVQRKPRSLAIGKCVHEGPPVHCMSKRCSCMVGWAGDAQSACMLPWCPHYCYAHMLHETPHADGHMLVLSN